MSSWLYMEIKKTEDFILCQIVIPLLPVQSLLTNADP